MKKLFVFMMLAVASVTITACDELSKLANQAAQVLNLKNCSFDINGVSDINMLGFKINKNMSMDNLTVEQAMKIATAVVNKRLPVTFNVDLDIDNPNSLAASMGKMDYIISLNNKEVISSTLNNGFSIPANSKGKVSIPISTDLFQLFSSETSDAILNLAFKLAGAKSNPINLGVKVKPYIKISNQSLAYPDYITINKVLQ